MSKTRRKFLSFTVAGGMAFSVLVLIPSYASGDKSSFSDDDIQARFDKLDQVLK